MNLDWDITTGVDSFSVGCLISELLLGVPLFCPCPEGPSYLRERLAVLCHTLGPFEQETGRQIEREHPGTFCEGDFTEPGWPDDMSDSTLWFIQNTETLEVGGMFYLHFEAHMVYADHL